MNRNPGNILFRTWVDLFRLDYLNSIKTDKVKISARIVAMIQHRGGRYANLEEDSKQWIPTSDQKALEKTSQALRELPRNGHAQVTDKYRTPEKAKVYEQRFFKLWKSKKVMTRGQELLECRASTAMLLIEPTEPLVHLESHWRNTGNTNTTISSSKKRRRDEEDNEDEDSDSVPLNRASRRNRGHYTPSYEEESPVELLTTTLDNRRIRVTTLELDDSFSSSSSSSSSEEEEEEKEEMVAAPIDQPYLDDEQGQMDDAEDEDTKPPAITSTSSKSATKPKRERPLKFPPSKVRRTVICLDRKQSSRPLYNIKDLQHTIIRHRYRQEEAKSKQMYQAMHDLDELATLGLVDRSSRYYRGRRAFGNGGDDYNAMAATTTGGEDKKTRKNRAQLLFRPTMEDEQLDEDNLPIKEVISYRRKSKIVPYQKKQIFGSGQPILFGGDVPSKIDRFGLF
jgi:hypothetical protein